MIANAKPRRSWPARRPPTEVDAAESLLLLGNSRDRCHPPSVQKQDGRRNKPQRSPAGGNTIAAERRWPSPPELPRPKSRPRLSNALPVIQRSSGDMRLNPHLHVVALDGLYVAGADGRPVSVHLVA